MDSAYENEKVIADLATQEDSEQPIALTTTQYFLKMIYDILSNMAGE